METVTCFKKCTTCGFVWQNLSELLGDPKVRLLGYQGNEKELQTGHILFNHACETTLAIQISALRELCEESAPIKLLVDGREWFKSRADEINYRMYKKLYEHEYVLKLLHVIKNWPKN